MINVTTEEVLPLSAAAKLLPRRRRGRPVAMATLYRWASSGLHGVRLEVVRVGGTTCTTRAALQRFCEELTRKTATGQRTRKVSQGDGEHEATLITRGY